MRTARCTSSTAASWTRTSRRRPGPGWPEDRAGGAPGNACVRDFLMDVRYAARMARGSPGITAAVVLSLGLAIGGNTAVFSVVQAILLRPLPFRDPDRLVWVW